MSYFNEPARLAMLNIKNEIDKEEEMEKPIENKGLLSRTNPMSFKENNQKGKSEIEKVIEYARNIRMEMRKYKNAI